MLICGNKCLLKKNVSCYIGSSRICAFDKKMFLEIFQIKEFNLREPHFPYTLCGMILYILK